MYIILHTVSIMASSTFTMAYRSQAQKATVASRLTFVFSNVGWALDGLVPIVRPRALFGIG